MDIQMTDIDSIVKDVFEKIGLDFTYDNRIKVLAGLAKNIAAMEDIDPLIRTHIALMITVEIVRLRTEKQIFEQ